MAALSEYKTSGSRLCWRTTPTLQRGGHSIPVAVTVFPGEIYRAPRSWAERAYHKLIYFNEVNKGSHFAGWDQPELLAAEFSRGVQIAALVGACGGAHNVRPLLSRGKIISENEIS